MSSIGTGYDLSASQFSPDGRVFQVEYAQKAVENSGTAIGLRGKDGVVFAVEKLVQSKLYEFGANKRIFTVDSHVGMAVAGLLADAKQIVETSRSECADYRSQYGSNIPLKYLNDRVSMFMHAYTLYSAVRPFGCSAIMGSYDPIEGPAMFVVDSSGVSHGYYGCAIGKAKQSAKTEMEKLNLANMSCRELVKEAARIIYLVHDELKDKAFELELSWVGEATGGRHERVPKEIFQEAEKFANSALEDDSESDSEDALIRIKDERREDWICFFCCHVRTATVSIGIWQLMLQILSLVTVAVMVSHPELADIHDMPITSAPPEVETSTGSPMPTPLSRTPSYTRDTQNMNTQNMNTQTNLIAIASTIALIYGAAKGRPFYLLPYFCLKVFDFCLAVVIAISYLCALPSLTALAKQAEEQGNDMVKKQLHNMNPSALGFVTILALVAALYIKLYLLSVIWRCYRYLTLRRMSGRATVSVLGAAGLAELGPDYDIHPAAAAAVVASGSAAGGLAANAALLNPPEYSKIVKEPPPMTTPRPETPPPPYSSTLNLNQATNTAPTTSATTAAAQQ